MLLSCISFHLSFLIAFYCDHVVSGTNTSPDTNLTRGMNILLSNCGEHVESSDFINRGLGTSMNYVSSSGWAKIAPENVLKYFEVKVEDIVPCNLNELPCDSTVELFYLDANGTVVDKSTLKSGSLRSSVTRHEQQETLRQLLIKKVSDYVTNCRAASSDQRKSLRVTISNSAAKSSNDTTLKTNASPIKPNIPNASPVKPNIPNDASSTTCMNTRIVYFIIIPSLLFHVIFGLSI